MSHANGQCRFKDGTILYFEYNGTGDWSYPRLWKTNAEMHKHWRTDVNAEHECTCGQEPEVCEMGTDYGGGSYAIGKACRKCMAIVVDALRFGNEEFDEKDGLPGWWKQPISNPSPITSSRDVFIFKLARSATGEHCNGYRAEL